MHKPTNRQPTILRNQRCAFCDCELNNENTDKEHVIARRFVPKGYMDRQWNLLLNSCRSCNRRKADLENDISAITMQPHPLTQVAPHEPHLSEAARKAKTRSPRTGKPVRESEEKTQIDGKLGPARLKIGLIAPPQIDRDRAYELARFQVAGFFYFLTYNNEQGCGSIWPGSYMPFLLVGSTDWGHPTLKGFAQVTYSWPYRLIAHTGNGHYAVAIKKHPTNNLWSFALEWNKNIRLAGFLGNETVAQAIADELPKPIMISISENERYRPEVPLRDDEEDLLFSSADF